jgi:hypothetical protein
MPDYTVEIALPDHKRGDRWPGISSIGPILINGSTPAGALARVSMHFIKAGGGIYRLDSDAATTPDAPITISNASTWAVVIPEVQDFLPTSGKWRWDMEFYETGKSSPWTLYKGELLVGNDITKTPA